MYGVHVLYCLSVLGENKVANEEQFSDVELQSIVHV
jgi:hypothetical protein